MQLNFPFMSENTTNTTTDTSAPASPSLTLGDLQAVINLIDIVSSRGAFKGAELTSVGTLRDTFDRFLKAHTPQETPAAPADTVPEEVPAPQAQD